MVHPKGSEERNPAPETEPSIQDLFYGELDQTNLDSIRTFDTEPGLRPTTKFGVFLWWSDREQWIHPDDRALIEQFVPGNRIFRKDPCDSFSDRELGYSVHKYGAIQFRALPIVWYEVKTEGYEVGDCVEVKSGQGKQTPGVAMIEDITWDRHKRVVQYWLSRNGMALKKPFLKNQFRPSLRLGTHFNSRLLNQVQSDI